MSTLNFSKVYILDKYFTSLYKFWENEKKLQQGIVQSETNTNTTTANGNGTTNNNNNNNNGSSEEIYLEQELKNLRTRLLSLGQQIQIQPTTTTNPTTTAATVANNGNNKSNSFSKRLNGKQQLQQSPQQNYYVNQSFSKVPIQAEPARQQPQNGSTSSIIGIGTRTTTSDSESNLTFNNPNKIININEISDLINLPLLTEDYIIRCLQSRFLQGNYFVTSGQILITTNPLNHMNNPLTLTSTRNIPIPPYFQKVTAEIQNQLKETNYPQCVILSGQSGSGKTYNSMLLLRNLFEIYKYNNNNNIVASICVLRSLGTARTSLNQESSRIGHFIEIQISEGIIYRTRLHCYFLDQTRIIKNLPDERNYHIFYQMLSGLTHEERKKLHLENYTVQNLNYLKSNDNYYNDEEEDKQRFQEWRDSLAILGIPFLDVLRVLSAILLLGNVEFVQNKEEVEVKAPSTLSPISQLLGISIPALFKGLTTRTHKTHNTLINSTCDANTSNNTRDGLAKSLYTRTLSTIVRRSNIMKKSIGTTSSNSTDSIKFDMISQRSFGTMGSKISKSSMVTLNNVVKSMNDSFIGILDLFGFEERRPSHLEQLCINLCSETMQHFYNTHIFKSTIESCLDEGLHCDFDYIDNVPNIDLISSLKTGLLSMLDVECSINGTVENYIIKIKQQHKLQTDDMRSFIIQHFAGKVMYDATMFMETNRDIIPDDLIAVFHKHRCSFGFASHLFSSELKVLGAGGVEPCPKGINFRISPTSSSGASLLNSNEPVTTLTQDFHTRLDNLLRTLVHSKPHFIRCLKINNSETKDLFDRHTISKQLRSFQILETINLMINSYTYKLRFKLFIQRYKCIVKGNGSFKNYDSSECQIILDNIYHLKNGYEIGKKYVFMSEPTRQHIEAIRTKVINNNVILIQCNYRGYLCRKNLPMKFKNNILLKNILKNKKRPKPILCTPPPTSIEFDQERDDFGFIGNKVVVVDQLPQPNGGSQQQQPPNIPPQRQYTINGSKKLYYPQCRIMKMSFQDTSTMINKGERVSLIGISSEKHGHVLIKYNNKVLHIPFQYLDFIQ